MERITFEETGHVSAILRGVDCEEINVRLHVQQLKSPQTATHVVLHLTQMHDGPSWEAKTFIKVSDVKAADQFGQLCHVKDLCLRTLRTWYVKQFDLSANSLIVLNVDELLYSRTGTLVEASIGNLFVTIWSSGRARTLLSNEGLDPSKEISQYLKNPTKDGGVARRSQSGHFIPPWHFPNLGFGRKR